MKAIVWMMAMVCLTWLLWFREPKHQISSASVSLVFETA